VADKIQMVRASPCQKIQSEMQPQTINNKPQIMNGKIRLKRISLYPETCNPHKPQITSSYPSYKRLFGNRSFYWIEEFDQ
jgi:hypothetical protein